MKYKKEILFVAGLLTGKILAEIVIYWVNILR